MTIALQMRRSGLWAKQAFIFNIFIINIIIINIIIIIEV